MFDGLKFDRENLVPVVAQDFYSGEIRMLAHANRAALVATRESGIAHFWSRSREKLWKKGETSGNTLHVIEIWIDCDKDSIVYLVDSHGPSCHTGRQTCFFRTPSEIGDQKEEDASMHRCTPTLSKLTQTIKERRNALASESYTRSLLDRGIDHIGDKLCEESEELAEAIKHETQQQVLAEAADVLYHLMVGLELRDTSIREVIKVLASRFKESGLEEKASRGSTPC